jgi:hypothetical protein
MKYYARHQDCSGNFVIKQGERDVSLPVFEY